MNDIVINKVFGFCICFFLGLSKYYLSIVFVIGVGIYVWFYGGLFVIEYWWYGWDWIIGWKFIIFLLFFVVVLICYIY